MNSTKQKLLIAAATVAAAVPAMAYIDEGYAYPTCGYYNVEMNWHYWALSGHYNYGGGHPEVFPLPAELWEDDDWSGPFGSQFGESVLENWYYTC